MKKYLLTLGLITAFVLSCGDDIKKSFTSPTPLTLSGTIAGKVIDRCTGGPP